MSASLTAASVTPRSSAPLRSRRRSRAVVAASSAPAPGSSGPRSADADDAAVDAAPASLPRRAVFGAALSLSLAVGLPAPGPALAIGFQKELKKRDVSDDDYLVSPGFAFRGQPHDGLRFYDQARGDGAKLWGSMIKQTLKRRRPGFNESFYGFESFSDLLEEAAKRKQLDLERDEKSGGYIVRGIAKSA